MRLCPPAGDIVGPGVGDWRRLQIYDDSSSSPATLESSRKLLRRERTSLFACLEIIWRVACCRDHRPHRGYPRTDQTRRIIYTRRRGGEGAWPNFPSMTFEGDGAGGGRENLFPSRCAKPRPPRLSFVTIRYLFISRREENDLIYIYFSWRSRKHSWTFSVWNVFCRGEGEECRSRSGEETGNPLIRFLDSLLVESGCRYPRLWPTHEIRHAWPSCFRAPQFRRRTRPVSRENLVSVRKQTSDQSETQFLARRCSLFPVVSSMGTRDGRKAEGRDNLCQLFNGRGKIGKPQKSQTEWKYRRDVLVKSRFRRLVNKGN